MYPKYPKMIQNINSVKKDEIPDWLLKGCMKTSMYALWKWSISPTKDKSDKSKAYVH